MASKNNATFQNKVKVLNKLFDAGCDTEKKLQQLDMAAILKIPNITIPDMTLIMEFQKQTKPASCSPIWEVVQMNNAQTDRHIIWSDMNLDPDDWRDGYKGGVLNGTKI